MFAEFDRGVGRAGEWGEGMGVVGEGWMLVGEMEENDPEKKEGIEAMREVEGRLEEGRKKRREGMVAA